MQQAAMHESVCLRVLTQKPSAVCFGRSADVCRLSSVCSAWRYFCSMLYDPILGNTPTALLSELLCVQLGHILNDPKAVVCR